MAFPKGLPRDLYTTMKADGRLPDWLAKHKAHSEAGTLEEWLKEQGLSLAPSSPKQEATKAAPKARKGVLAILRDASIEFHQFISGSPLAAGDFDSCDLDELIQANAALGAVDAIISDVQAHFVPIIARLQREADLLAELENEQLKVAEALEENERLKAQILAMEQTLVVNGHSDKVTKGKGKAVPTLVS